jgi:hypothetical protein
LGEAAYSCVSDAIAETEAQFAKVAASWDEEAQACIGDGRAGLQE